MAAELGLPLLTVATFGLAVGVPDPTEDGRLAAYDERHGPAGGWSERVLQRLAGPESMAGRHVLRDALEGLGLPSR